MEFTVVLRGYDREQVDRAFEQIQRGTLSALAASQIQFRVVMRGYDREQVEMTLARLAASS